MSDRRGLAGDAVALLLTLMETAEAELSGEALQDFYPAAGAALIAAGALQPSGYEPVVTCLADHDDAPVSVTWRDDLGGYAYFSPSVGWVKVEHERLRRYRVDFPWLLATLARQLRIPRAIEPLEDIEGFEAEQLRQITGTQQPEPVSAERIAPPVRSRRKKSTYAELRSFLLNGRKPVSP